MANDNKSTAGPDKAADKATGDAPATTPDAQVDPATTNTQAAVQRPEVEPYVTPDAGGDRLLAAAQAKAPNLTREFCDAYGLGDDVLAGIARGEIPPPPANGPIHTSDLYLTPGGWVSAPPGVPLEAAGGNAIAR
jgi:hypothetical protein